MRTTKPPEIVFKPLHYVRREIWDDNYTFPDLSKRKAIPISSDIPAADDVEDKAKGSELVVSGGMMELPINNVIFSYTNTKVCHNFKECKAALQRMHLESLAYKLPDIPYNFLVGGDGLVYEGRGWMTVPELNEQYDMIHGYSMEIAYFGVKGRTPPIVQAVAAWDFIQYSIKTTIVGQKPIFFTCYR